MYLRTCSEPLLGADAPCADRLHLRVRAHMRVGPPLEAEVPPHRAAVHQQRQVRQAARRARQAVDDGRHPCICMLLHTPAAGGGGGGGGGGHSVAGSDELLRGEGEGRAVRADEVRRVGEQIELLVQGTGCMVGEQMELVPFM